MMITLTTKKIKKTFFSDLWANAQNTMMNIRIAILIIIIVFNLTIKMGAIVFTILSSKVAPDNFHFDFGRR